MGHTRTLFLCEDRNRTWAIALVSETESLPFALILSHYPHQHTVVQGVSNLKTVENQNLNVSNREMTEETPLD